MKEIIAYEMAFQGPIWDKVDITCVPFQKKYWNEYMKIYNECFFEMRKALEEGALIKESVTDVIRGD